MTEMPFPTTFQIGIWGTANAGKTTYLAMLYQMFLSEHQDWEIIPANDLSRQFVIDAAERLFRHHEFPEKSSEVRAYHYDIIPHDPVRLNLPQEFTIAFYDAPGELYEAYYHQAERDQVAYVLQRATTDRITEFTPQMLFDQLIACDGLLIFIDPGRDSQRERAQTQLLLNLFEDMRKARRDSTTVRPAPLVALCLSKIDAEETMWDHREAPRDDCFRKYPDTARNEAAAAACAKSCPLYHQLGDWFLRRQLPGVLPIGNSACFPLSAVGRSRTQSINTSLSAAWQRPPTPAPPHLLTSVSNHIPVQEPTLPAAATFYPRSIVEPDQINPQGMLEPILWLAQGLAARGR